MSTAFRTIPIPTAYPRKKNGLFHLFSQRKEETYIFHFDRYETKAHSTIGFLACDSGVGVTQLAIALCSYCVSKKQKRAAYLELHERNEIARVLPDADFSAILNRHAKARAKASSLPGTTMQEPLFFSLRGVDYYPHVSYRDVPLLLNRDYDYLIMDLGCMEEADLSEFLRCDIKFILGSLAPWKIWKYEKFLKRLNHSVNLGEGCNYLVQMGTSHDISRFSKANHIAVREVPFIKDPFRIEKQLFLFFEDLLAP